MKVDDCKRCANHQDMYCLWAGDRVRILPMQTPMYANRMKMEQLGESVRTQTLNYFVPTKILYSTKTLSNDKYTAFRLRVLNGEFKVEGAVKNMEWDENTLLPKGYGSVMYLCEGTDIAVNGHKYAVCNEKPVGGERTGVQYLYEIHDLEGHADIKINDKNYVLRHQPITHYREDAILAMYGKYAVIGKKL